MEANMEEEKKGTESKYAGLSKGQIKKIKDKEKKDKAAAAGGAAGAEGGVEVGLEDAAGEEAPGKGVKAAKKGKKAKGGLSEAAKARLLETQKAQREEDELRERLQREADETYAKKIADAAAIENAAKEIADEKKRARLEEKNKLKAEGKWLTKKQIALKKVADARRAAMVAAGLVPAETAEDENEDGKPTGSMIRKQKKPKKTPKDIETTAAAESETPAE